MSYPFLRGVRVIESSAFIAAPLAGLTLSEFGAEVIRVDLIGGGIDYGRMPLVPSGRSLYWTGLNKGKKSVAVDLRSPHGREIVQRLATAPGADGGVLLTNIGVPWLDHATLAARRADVITCTIEGNFDGSTAVDYTVNCATGYPYVTGAGDAPVNSVFPAWDACCAYQAAMAVACAVLARRQTGAGAQLRLALSDVAFSMLSHLGVMTEAEVLGAERDAIGNHIYGAFGRDFVTRDGRRLMVAGVSAGQWRTLVDACGLTDELAALQASLHKDFAIEADRFDARDAIAAVFERWFAVHGYDEVAALFDARRVCWGPYRSVRELLAHDPRVGAGNPLYERIDTPGVGGHWAAGTPVRTPDLPRAPLQPAALLGQHTDEVLAQVLGLDAAERARLFAAGVVAGPDDADPTVREARSAARSSS
ncbi:2-methylfumaryl-CoA isomerase [Paraburkholderia caballeronis]|uniref:CoA transferase n=1 Tax=Paraburkholderia caballeronis TaxID=416943 RepID=UPI001065CC7A|nr:CoA transferase [Paraburkholderia caballeronis]TDV35618.1 2-methylfumaryl-CoA isomerase [Paraburkholderia caballeronis]